VGDLPQNFQAKHIAVQLLLSGTAAAPNYGEARAAESRADFIHKLGIALKEFRLETWLSGMFFRSAAAIGDRVGHLKDSEG